MHLKITLEYVAGTKSTVLGMAQARKACSVGALCGPAGSIAAFYCRPFKTRLVMNLCDRPGHPIGLLAPRHPVVFAQVDQILRAAFHDARLNMNSASNVL